MNRPVTWTRNRARRSCEILLDLNRERGTTLVFVTHDPAIASRTQRIIRLHDGLIVQDGQPEPAAAGG